MDVLEYEQALERQDKQIRILQDEARGLREDRLLLMAVLGALDLYAKDRKAMCEIMTILRPEPVKIEGGDHHEDSVVGTLCPWQFPEEVHCVRNHCIYWRRTRFNQIGQFFYGKCKKEK